MNRRTLIKTLALSLGTSAAGTAARAVMAGVSASDSLATHGLGTLRLDTIACVAELIIPATDTPGAIAADVPAFIQVIYSRWYRPEERNAFDSGLIALDAVASELCNSAFAQCSAEQQHNVLLAAQAQPESPAGKFFATMKELTVFGYYTSEVGSKEELIFNPVPMRYKGDYLFSDVGRQWTP